ncbi:hypothetical protein OGAPHI_006154 [Ogataea philodendri]|uniref:DNA polymerase n=1 Tax=Ogataea philodendri TaxID=1378263 RepID=A0A9P8NYR6_9ASCO|nr:uncharacterized protein OGAPHI_006154 [Ogataea philodendri]KAH3661975.1 hypothetical protein OGAPHI_006154 [Ogataea philodendri]
MTLSANKILAGIRLVVVPRARSQVDRARVSIWKDQGATVDSFLKDPRSVVVVTKKLTKDKVESSIKRELKDAVVVRPEWVIDSLVKQTVLPFDGYQYVFETNQKPSPKSAKTVKPVKFYRGDKRLLEMLQMGVRINKQDMNLSASNAKIIKQFEEIIRIYETMRYFHKSYEFKIKNYRIAISAIESLDHPITSASDLSQFGLDRGSISKHIEEIIRTGTFAKLETLRKQEQNDERYQLMTLFKGIHGVGDKTAYRFVKAGYKKIQDIVQDEQMYASLTEAQKLGITYYDDWNERIPREEVEQHYEFIKDEAAKLDGNLRVALMGSYRRGSPDSGDIDLMVYQEGVDDPKEVQQSLFKLASALAKSGFIVCSLTDILPDMQKFNGGCKLPGKQKCRRLDFIGLPYSQLGSATIYFVGNDIFNRCLRLLAQMKGYHLNQKGLFSADGKQLIESFDEKEILRTLGLDWVDYVHRNI